MSYIMYLFFASHCRNYSMLCRPMQYMNRIALMHRILTTPVPQNYLCLLHHKCRLSRKSLISVLEHMSLVLVLEGQVLSCIRPYLDLHSAKTIATSIVRSKLDYCNSLYYSLPKYQINRLQHIQNALARTVVEAPKFQHINPIQKSRHWFKVSEWVKYRPKIISLTKLSVPLSHHISSIQPHGHNTRSSPCHSDQTTNIAQSHCDVHPIGWRHSMRRRSGRD